MEDISWWEWKDSILYPIKIYAQIHPLEGFTTHVKKGKPFDLWNCDTGRLSYYEKTYS